MLNDTTSNTQVCVEPSKSTIIGYSSNHRYHPYNNNTNKSQITQFNKCQIDYLLDLAKQNSNNVNLLKNSFTMANNTLNSLDISLKMLNRKYEVMSIVSC